MTTKGSIVIIGGSSGIGLAVAHRCLQEGARVLVAGRSSERLASAAAELGEPDRVATVQADIADRGQLAQAFDRAEPVAHVVVTAADLPYGQVATLTEDSIMRAIRSKILGPLLVAQSAAVRLEPGASITFVSGIAAYRPAPGGSLAAIANGALESMVRALALEIAPVRVNAVSPGWVDTPVWDAIAAPEVKAARLAEMAGKLPGRRIGEPEDVANAIGFLMHDRFVTGTVLHVEGGQLLV